MFAVKEVVQCRHFEKEGGDFSDADVPLFEAQKASDFLKIFGG